MGVVVDHLPATKSNGTDFLISFTICDPSWLEGQGLKIRFFRPDKKRLPAISSNGDVILLRNIKITGHTEMPGGLSNFSTTWIVFPQQGQEKSRAADRNELVNMKSSADSNLSHAENEYALELFRFGELSTFNLPAKPTSLQVAAIMQEAGGKPPKMQTKFALVQDLVLPAHPQDLKFADLLGDVRRLYANDQKVELSITDYTTNKALFNYTYGCDEEGVDGDAYQYITKPSKAWPGPWGKMTITIALWDAHAAFARKHVREGSIVFLRNVQISLGKDRQRMEGNLRGDRYHPSKVNVSLRKPRQAEGDEQMMALLKRKRDYEAKATAQSRQFVRDASTMKKKRPIDTTDQPKVMTKTQKQKEKRRKKKNAKLVEGMIEADQAEVKKAEANSHVRCNKVDVPLKSIDDILDPEILQRTTVKGNAYRLPFQNSCYHSKVKVVDFFPDDIADFAAPFRDSDYDVLSEDEDHADSLVDMTQDGPDELRWEWRFCLLVEDSAQPPTGQQREQMEMLVADGDGDFLLKMDACDLRNRPQELAILREKLFVLWGDLQERKESQSQSLDAVSRGASAKPFECCIKEYGIPLRDADGNINNALEYERMFRMFGTTIM